MNNKSSNIMSLLSQVDKRMLAAGVAAVGAGGAMLATTQTADAAIVYSGNVNLPIPNNFYGIYLNVETGAFTTPAGPGGQAAGWDINPWQGGANLFQNTGAQYVAVGTQATNLAPGTPINSATVSSPGTANFTAGVEGIVGFRFADAANGNHFGWFRLNKATGAGVNGTIRDYAWESTVNAPINAGAPEPGSLALLALGAAGIIARRRRIA